jgi:hypothetical protein
MPHSRLSDREQESVRTLLAELRLRHELVGQGGELGVAYAATLRGTPLIAKLPVTIAAVRRSAGERPLALALRAYDDVSVEEFKAARAAFRREHRHAERVLVPPSERLLLRARRPTSAFEHDVIHRARLRWREWPGHAHMHPVVHFDPHIPLLLLSASAQGTVRQLPARHWAAVAWQLSEALTFLRHAPKLAHADLKPDNVLFFFDGEAATPHIWLSDYGPLRPMDRATAFRVGTARYMPDAEQRDALVRSRRVTYDQQQLFAYYATLLDLFFEEEEEEKPNVSAGLKESIRARSPLVERASPELYAHVMRPLLLDAACFSELPARFHRTREWLGLTGIAVRAHPQGEGLLERA